MKSHKFKLLSLILGDIIYLASTTIMLNYACPKLSSFELSLEFSIIFHINKGITYKHREWYYLDKFQQTQFKTW